VRDLPHRKTTASPDFIERFEKLIVKNPSLNEQIKDRIEKLQNQLDFSDAHHHHIPACRRIKFVGNTGIVIIFHREDRTLALDALVDKDDI
jgi:hypothetical protein